MNQNILEVCIASVHDAIEAVAGGANRLELNCALELGGLTPTAGKLAAVKKAVNVPVIVMVRPRAAGFCYDQHELSTMLSDAKYLLSQGADGIAFGALTSNRAIDMEACRLFVELTREHDERESVFHRAFDVIGDVDQGAQQLIDLGVTRLLTSGQAESAIAGADVISHLQRNYGDQLEILPAAGITPTNVRQLLSQTACTQVHGSFGRTLTDHGGVVAESDYRSTDRSVVRAVRQRMG